MMSVQDQQEAEFCQACLKGKLGSVKRMLAENPRLANAKGEVHPDHRAFMEKQGSAGGWTALHLAAHYGRPKTVMVLVEAGADVNALSENKNGNTPLMAAVAGNHPEIAAYLLSQGADPQRMDMHGKFSAVRLAELEEKKKFVDLFRKHINKPLPNETP